MKKISDKSNVYILYINIIYTGYIHTPQCCFHCQRTVVADTKYCPIKTNAEKNKKQYFALLFPPVQSGNTATIRLQLSERLALLGIMCVPSWEPPQTSRTITALYRIGGFKIIISNKKWVILIWNMKSSLLLKILYSR